MEDQIIGEYWWMNIKYADMDVTWLEWTVGGRHRIGAEETV
jgi:hypothetical protein